MFSFGYFCEDSFQWRLECDILMVSGHNDILKICAQKPKEKSSVLMLKTKDSI